MSKTIGYILPKPTPAPRDNRCAFRDLRPKGPQPTPAPQEKPAAPKAARKKADAEQEKAHD